MSGNKGRRPGSYWYAPEGADVGSLFVTNASGLLVPIAPGDLDDVLTSNGAGALPSYRSASGGGSPGTGSTLSYTTDLRFWYKASNATRTGSRITALADDASSPGGVTLTQGTTASQPYYLPSRWNRQPFMLFSGSHILTAASSPMNATNNFTVFVVAIVFAYDTTSRWIWINGTGANGYGLGVQNTGIRSLVGSVADRDTTALWFPTEPQIVMLQRSSGTMSFYRNNHSIGNTNTDSVTAPTAFSIGGSANFVGAIAEVIGFNAVLSGTDRGTVFADLGAAYNIPVE